MDIPNFMLQRHQYLHETFFPNLRNTLTEEEFRQSPVKGIQPIIWLIWHMARVEDMGLSRFIWRKSQIFDATWRDRMGIEQEHYGTSMSEEEVATFAAQVDVYAVLDYFKLVGERTKRELSLLDLSTLDEILSDDAVREVVTVEGMASPEAQWVIPHYVGKSRGWMLCHMGLTHNFRHFGQIVLAKKLLRYSN